MYHGITGVDELYFEIGQIETSVVVAIVLVSKVEDDLSDKIYDLIFPRDLKAKKLADDLTAKQSEVDKADPVQVESVILSALGKVDVSSSEYSFVSKRGTREQLRAINTFFFWAYYPNLLQARPEISVLQSVLQAEKATGRLNAETVDRYQSLLRRAYSR